MKTGSDSYVDRFRSATEGSETERDALIDHRSAQRHMSLLKKITRLIGLEIGQGESIALV